MALTACSGTPAAPTTPTIQAAATQAVGAAQSGGATVVAGASPAVGTAIAAASPAAATAQAAAAPAAATIQAGAAPAGATAASIVGTAVGAIPPLGSPSPSPSPAALLPASQTPLRIADASLADATPWLSIQNDGDQPVDVGGWKLQVGSTTAALPDDAVVQPGSALTIHAGEGMSSDDELFLGDAGDLLASAALPGTPVRLTDESGRVVAEVTVPRF